MSYVEWQIGIKKLKTKILAKERSFKNLRFFLIYSVNNSHSISLPPSLFLQQKLDDILY